MNIIIRMYLYKTRFLQRICTHLIQKKNKNKNNINIHWKNKLIVFKTLSTNQK
jgi:hypothetical protein